MNIYDELEEVNMDEDDNHIEERKNLADDIDRMATILEREVHTGRVHKMSKEESTDSTARRDAALYAIANELAQGNKNQLVLAAAYLYNAEQIKELMKKKY